jgi:hypothetical protein
MRVGIGLGGVLVCGAVLCGCGSAGETGIWTAGRDGDSAAGSSGEAGAGSADERPSLPDSLPELDESALPEPEADVGFVELEPRAYVDPLSLRQRGTTGGARLFYRFIPADEEAKQKPVLVFFNGGPGYTSMLLHTFGTGPLTLNAEALDEPPAPNPSSFSRLGNLLYIDARQAGFSYGITRDPADSRQRSAGYGRDSFGPATDAADFALVVLRVLKRQPALQNNRVVLIGESYGGARANLMLSLLLYPHSPFLQDETLGAELAGHYASVFGGVDPQLFGPELFSLQFGWQVLLQPFVAGPDQTRHQDERRRELLERTAAERGIAPAEQAQDFCTYDVRRSHRECELVDEAMTRSLLDLTQFEAWMGVPPTSVGGLTAADRTDAFRIAKLPTEAASDPEAWRERAGELPEWDRYFSPFALKNTSEHFDAAFSRPHLAFAFLLSARYAKTLITNAAFDSVVMSDAIVPALRDTLSRTHWVDRIEYGGRDQDEPSDSFWIRYVADELVGAAAERIVYLRNYEQSGHMITLTQPDQLLSDVAGLLDDPD